MSMSPSDDSDHPSGSTAEAELNHDDGSVAKLPPDCSASSMGAVMPAVQPGMTTAWRVKLTGSPFEV